MRYGDILPNWIILLVMIVVGGYTIGVVGTTVDSSLQPKARSTTENPGAEKEISEQSTQESTDPSNMLCGRYSLFILFRLLGHDIPYTEIEHNTPVGPKGSSFLELQEAARRLGVEMSIYKCDPTCVEVVRNTPCIVLIREGHYVVTEPVCGADNVDQVNIIDGLFYCRESLSDKDFASIWTGYYLTSSPCYSSVWPQWTVAVGAICFLGLAAWRFRRRTGQTGGCASARVESHLTEV